LQLMIIIIIMTIIIIIIIIIIINCASVGKQINFDSIKMNSMYVKKKVSYISVVVS